MFTPKGPHHKNCCTRCAYISVRLAKNYNLGLTREETIEYYGEMYDNPLRSLIRSKHRELMTVIYDYCEETGKQTFIHRDIAKLGKIKMIPQSLSVCAADVQALSKTGNKVRIGHGKHVIEWRFTKRLLEPITVR